MQIRTNFQFDVQAPYEMVAPLFGAHEERRWAQDWDPRFIHPQPAADVEGAVFVTGGSHPIVWVNTLFDLEGGRVQYVNFNPEGVVTRIDIHLGRSVKSTSVRVAYERTAIVPEAVTATRRLAEGDASKEAEWRASIEGCLTAVP